MADTNKETLVQKLTNIADGFRTSRSLTETLSLDDMATLAAVPIGGENKFTQLVDGTITEVTAEDLEGVTRIKNYAFANCLNLERVIMPNTITSVGTSPFTGSNSLNTIIFSNNLTTLPERVAQNLTALTNVIIPEGVQVIAYYSFYGCTNLKNLTLPSSITQIKTNSLRIGSETNKVTITLLSTTPPALTSGAIAENYLNKIIVPAGCGETYRTATNWSNLADYIEEAAE